MNVWLGYQMYKNNFLNTFLTPFVDSRWFFSTFWRWRSIFQFDVLLKSTQRWECELLQEHVHTQTHAPETFQNLDKYDYRWQVGGLHLVCRLLFCCYAHTPSRTGSFPTLAPCFFLFFFLNSLYMASGAQNDTCCLCQTIHVWQLNKKPHTLPI